MIKYLVLFLLLSISIFPNLDDDTKLNFRPNDSVSDLLVVLDDYKTSFKPRTVSEDVSAEIGEDIITKGFSKRDGLKKSREQSKHFVCTSCHNVEKEDVDLSTSNPQERLVYTHQQGLPFLQGTTLYGAVNRESFYNGDYDKKYGKLVDKARNDIREAIQLCAVECAQGRKLDTWEVESILAYLWKIDLKMKDLILSDEEKVFVSDALENVNMRKEAAQIIQSKYLKGSPATFTPPPSNRWDGYGNDGDPQNGKLIYENSCLHCHYRKKYSYLHLDNSKLSFKYLANSVGTYNRSSLYQVIRYGTFPKHGKHSYMPFYPDEKMSNQQVEDLRAYIKLKAG